MSGGAGAAGGWLTRSRGVVRKWLSMSWAPSRNWRTMGNEYWSARGTTPTLEQTL